MASDSLFLLFLLSIITLSQANVNIDCGTSLSGVDANNLKWVGDKDFITSGESATVASTAVEISLTTLRYFPTGESNCYNIPVTKGGKVLVRTMYYYGNYDGKSSSPTFSVVFEGKHRRTVSISSASEPYILELIFAPASGETSVCFVRSSSSSNPFVSSIEVADLADGMYDELGPNEGLFYQQRRAYGYTGVIRSDPYGRFWLSSELNIMWTGLPSGAASIDTSDASNKPPESILRYSWSADSLTLLVDPTLPTKGVPVYLAMYFSEPLTMTVRSFNILFGGKKVGTGPVVPEYGKATQVVVRDVVASSTSQLVFQSTPSALAPPMINALELYVISSGTSGDGSGSGTGGSGSGSGTGGGGGGGGGGSGSGGPAGSGGTGGSNGGSSGGSTNEEKKSKLPIIVGAVTAVAVVIIACVIVAIVSANRRRAKLQLQGLTLQPSTVIQTGTGAFPLSGEQTENEANQSTDEAFIDDLIGPNDSYVTQQH